MNTLLTAPIDQVFCWVILVILVIGFVFKD